MTAVKRKIRVIGQIGEREISAIFDTDSNHTVIRESIAKKLGVIRYYPRGWKIGIAVQPDGKPIFAIGTIELYAIIDGKSLWFSAYIPEFRLEDELLIGADIMRVWETMIDVAKDGIKIKRRSDIRW